MLSHTSSSSAATAAVKHAMRGMSKNSKSAIRTFSSTPMRTPVRRHSGGHLQSMRPLSSLAASTPTTSSKISSPSNSASVHATSFKKDTRQISTTPITQIEQSHPVEAEGDMATTQDHVVIDVSGVSFIISPFTLHVMSCHVRLRVDFTLRATV